MHDLIPSEINNHRYNKKFNYVPKLHYIQKKLIFYLFPTIRNSDHRKEISNEKVFPIKSIFTEINITEKKRRIWCRFLKISTRKVTLRFDDSVFTTKTKCGSSFTWFFIDVLVRVNRGLLPIRIHNGEQCSWICDPETEISPSSLNKEPNSAFIHCHKPWISINDLISLSLSLSSFSSRNLFYFVSRREGILFEKRRNKIFFLKFDMWKNFL